MPSLLVAADVREHVDTDLSDAALGLLIDDADALIVQRYGPHTGAVTERFMPALGERVLFPSRPVDPSIGVTVTRSGVGSSTVETVAVTDYVLDGSAQVRLLAGGFANQVVTLTYTPVDDRPRRRRVLLDLVRLALRYDALSSSTMGDASVSHVDYDAERQRLLGSLGSAMGAFA